MRQIYLIRHGNAYDKSWKQLPNSPLNKNGIEHAEAMARRFKDFKIQEVYSSTMERAKDTCQTFLTYHPGVTPKYEDSLREVVDEYFANDHDKLIYLIDKFIPIKQRVFDNFKSLVEGSKGENVFIFTHGHFIRFVVLGILRGDVLGFFNMNVDFASVTVVRIKDNGNLELAVFNDCSHTNGLDYGCSWC
ncbi:MAG: histidine phosphatase family protein [Patescibacteria group bacterium]